MCWALKINIVYGLGKGGENKLLEFDHFGKN